MYHIQGPSQQNCRLLAVLCGEFANRKREEAIHQPSYPFPGLISSGCLEVHTLTNPTLDEYREAQLSFCPNFLYFQGEQLENEEEIGSLVWGKEDVSDPQTFSSLVAPSLPTVVYLEVPRSEDIAQTLHSKGVPYVIYWNTAFSSYAASHFRQALLSVLQSNYSYTWDAFQFALASFRLYCVRNNYVLPATCQIASGKFGPFLIGDAPRSKIILQEKAVDEEENSSDAIPIKIHDGDMDMRFLVCGVPCPLDACLLGSLEDGLNALLNIEIRGSKLYNRISAGPPPFEDGTTLPGVVTVRCDITTSSSAHISLLVSGSAYTCYDDQLLECQIKNEITEKSQLVRPLPDSEEVKASLSEPLSTASIASGASVFEVCMKVPAWAAKTLCHLAPEFSYRGLVTLGIASVNGIPVASFEKEDADRLLFFCTRQRKDMFLIDGLISGLPALSTPPTSRRCRPSLEDVMGDDVARPQEKRVIEGLKVAALRPIPRVLRPKWPDFLGIPETDVYGGNKVNGSMITAPSPKCNFVPPAPRIRRKSMPRSFRAQQMIPLNPLAVKKHGCDRSPIHVCSEEEFLRDLMQFLILRGHSWLVPQGGISNFPDAILNAKRLDLFNLYREVVSRGGFRVGNGINWKGQVFLKMRNHTVSHRMTGVGNALKRHYKTYLLEYELAHDDVDGECCLLCHSSTPGDWVNCCLCGEWAHFGCDRRQSLGVFKDYAKTDGMEYICPSCSLTSVRKKSRQTVNEFPSTSIVSWQTQ